MKLFVRLGLLIFYILVLTGCITNTITGRSQFIMFDASQDSKLGLSAFNEVKKSAPLVTTGYQINRINRIGLRIAAVSDRPEFDWDFILIDEPTLNAWALPGGKIAIYSKMAEALSDEEMAAVLGHEIAHAVLRHGAESLSRTQIQELTVTVAAAAASTQVEDRESKVLVATLASLAADGFVRLPHSRFMELEADDIGTLYMARAGYDPRGAVSLWRKMATLKEGGGPPKFLSTHPADDKRIERIESKMPRYIDAYRNAKNQFNR